ncbi:Serine/arginine-rich splicing factor SC35 [Zea mays]|uniref:RRM domain-containing protein n=2 Tax=Zea mays TaxID=4577 RepID=A0A3L6G1Y9_MAIZE|nr:hypothetical protein Zm00014a_035542 [Zea mays]PWZ41017.1 Serine/arginine-rich splicing factor SC35 [Zea mays]
MSRFGRSGPPPPIRDTYSLLVLNITFRTTADDLFPLFDKYGEIVDIYIPRDRRTGDSRGFAFVRYKYEDEAQKAVDRLDGRLVDGREIMVQFAKYGPNAERMYRDDYRDDYQDRDYRKRSRSQSRDGYARDSLSPARRSPSHSRSRSYTPDDYKRRGKDSASPASRSPSRSPPRKTPPSPKRSPVRHNDDRSPRSRSPST